MTATMVMIIDSCCYIYHDDDAGDQTKYVDRILFGKIAHLSRPWSIG